MSESQFSARKRGVTHVEDGESGSTASCGEQTDVPHNDDEETKRIMRKVDWYLIPPLMALYIISFMDRSNIGNAKVAGMNADLELTGTQYNMALTVFFIPYALFEVPSNVVLNMMPPSRWLMILVIAWGTVMTMQGIVKNYNQLIVTRTLLGFTEAGFFPAASYLLTTWYPRWEIQTRLAIFFTGASLAGAFSGLLAFAIQHMDGIAGLGGWRWIFILEGILTVLMGCTIPFLLPDSPQAAKFLTVTETDTVISRLQHDAGPASAKIGIDDSFKWAFLKEALLDWKIYLACIIFWGNSLGYTAAQAQLHTVPIYFVGTCSTMFIAYNADRLQKRWPFIIIPFGIAVVGFVSLLAVPHPRLSGLTYTFLFFIPAGLYPSVIGCISWVGNNLAPSYKHAIGMALLLTIGNLGGAVGSNIFLANQAPHYWLGYGFSLAIIVCGIFATLILRFAIKRINERRDQIPEAETLAKYTEDELMDMGDKSPLCRYVL
ncbi:major facilitator superfamily domain-containing protein [Ilyonectria sp. MPI-CAGE-AT-0026]|nr:major facilitator superfamily domain-containing protein [Ilyonectria sp. MPI-CAGE-AT-0026]